MMRVLELIVALIIVAVLGVVVGVIMPGHGHVERSLVLGKDMHQVYDILNNYRRFPDYSELSQSDSSIKYTFSGPAYGPGAEVSWHSDAAKVSDGKLTIASAQPEFYKIDPSVTSAQIIWNLDNDWRGSDKHFTLDLQRQGRSNRLTKVTWSYDVAYGFNLVNRYSNLYIHGDPDAFIQFSLGALQNVLATIPSTSYEDLVPYIEQTQPTPVLTVSTQIERKGGEDALAFAIAGAEEQIKAAAKKLGVKITGPRTLFFTDYGDQTFKFDVALPIDATTLKIGDQQLELTAMQAPSLAAAPAAAASAPANAGSAPAAAGSAPAAATSSEAPAQPAGPGSRDRYGRVIVDANVRGMLAYGGPALMGVWNGYFAGVPQVREMLKAYAQTHGYPFDDVTHRVYSIEVKPQVVGGDGKVESYAKYQVYLPLQGDNLPEQTPEQAANIPQPSLDAAPAASSSAPAAAGSSAAPAEAGTAG